MIKAIIIDDERSNRQVLQQLILKFCKDVEITAVAENAISGKAMIVELRPDIVFLDIEMPYQNGFEMLESMEKKDFKVIFITAHDAYKTLAQKYNPLDFLLKPISPKELIAAVSKLNKIVF